MKLLIIGAGGYGRLVAEIAQMIGWKIIDYLDDNSADAVGKIEELEELQNLYDGVVIAIGDANVRKNIAKKAEKLVSIIHPTAVISPSSKIDDGCVIEANVVINSVAEICECSYICAGAVVNHDAKVASYCQVDCNAVVGQGSKVPEKTKVKSCCEYKS